MPDTKPTSFSTLQDAIVAGLRACKGIVPDTMECGVGAFRRPDNTFGHTVPATGKSGSIDDMPLRFPSNSTLMAFGHTHPLEAHVTGAEDTTDGFSPQDAKFAKRHKEWEMYLGSPKTDAITRLGPGAKKTTNGVVYGTYVDSLTPPTRREAIEAAYDQHTKPTP